MKKIGLLFLTVMTFSLGASSVFAEFSPFGPTVVRNPPPGSIKEGYRYGRAVLLQYQSGSNRSYNGTMLGTYQWLAASGGNIPIYRSTDDGRSWTSNPIAQVFDTEHTGYMLTSQPTLYELPIAIGNMPAGTILLAALSKQGETGGNTYIDLYRSNNAGNSWSYVSTVARGGQPVQEYDPVWEPFMYAYTRNGSNRLVVYYSDERDPNYSQKLVHQVSTNGVSWGSVVTDVVDSDRAGRPGMAVVARMKNGQYIMTYEHCETRDCRVEYKVSSDPENWINAQEHVLQLPDGTIAHSSPYVIGMPDVGPNGAVVIGARAPNHLWINYENAAPGSRWMKVHATVEGAWSRSFVVMEDGKTIFITSTPYQPDGMTRWEVGNQYLGEVTDNLTSGSWYLVNRASGKYLEVASARTENGAFVSEYAYTRSPTQQWRFEATDSGYYRIVNVNSGKYLEVENAYVSDNRKVQQWELTNSWTQDWRVIDQGTNYVQLFNRNSGKTFDIHGSTASQPPMMQYEDTGANAQQWQLIRAD